MMLLGIGAGLLAAWPKTPRFVIPAQNILGFDLDWGHFLGVFERHF
jgi:hypothetical protein